MDDYWPSFAWSTFGDSGDSLFRENGLYHPKEVKKT